MPTTLVSTNAAGPSIERSTWVSAARCMIASGCSSARIRAICSPVANVGVIEAMLRRVFDFTQRFETARVSELVDVDHGIAARHEVPHDRAADKPGAARDHDPIDHRHLQARLDLGEQRRGPVLLGDDYAGGIDRPVDAHSGIVEADRAIAFRRI